MKQLLIFFFLSTFTNLYSQEYIFGKVTSEQNTEMAGVLVINIKTDEETYTNKDGNFMIAAKSNDLLRFVKQKFDRVSYTIKPEDFQKAITISMQKSTIEIEEVEIKTKLTGNLAKDSKALNKSAKTLTLNQEMDSYMRMKPEKPFPTLRTPSAFEKPNVNAAQVDIIKAIGFITKLIKGNKKPEFNPNQNTIKGFSMRVRYNLTDQYFIEMGLKIEEIDGFLKYADNRFQLTKNYYNNFNLAKIQLQLESVLDEYKKNLVS
ncbi:hypothetical protein GCM10010992_23100 [Cloacibacterium rupense]|uniref:CarboxypepD_reg-like domain-containing protein n=1 Tax=Cloacibacterium rupense TaxID=517423 RepID=A0ABQ2NKP7_9FLAO|nr:carboxypeptidase-like regulatory domain-containing protein [Cloacibacterium rupense]GGP05756.1 hypothetical protein GCM10010992_23100 [Cloacibacterium rupense]